MNLSFGTLSLTDWKDIATVFGVLLALATLLKSAIEYVRQGTQKRAELFMTMQRRFRETPTLDLISEMLEKNDPALANIPFKDKSTFLCFFEEIALLIKSGLLRKNVAHYMFGYYAIRCWENDYFWIDVSRQGPYWSLFRYFVAEMEAMEKLSPFKIKRFSF